MTTTRNTKSMTKAALRRQLGTVETPTTIRLRHVTVQVLRHASKLTRKSVSQLVNESVIAHLGKA
jgi:uncharacterized protein (DUF1778 family)